MLWPILVGSNEREIDFRLHDSGELNLRFLGCFDKTLESLPIFAEIYALLALEFRCYVLDNLLIIIVTT